MLLAYAEEARGSPEQDEGDSVGDRRNCCIPRAYLHPGLRQAPAQVRSRGLQSHTRLEPESARSRAHCGPRGSLGPSEHPELSQTYPTRRWSGGG